MKSSILLLLLPVFSFLFMHGPYFESARHYVNDSSFITHVLDGSINEWPEERFTLHNQTTIRYAADNDAHDLFLAVSITSSAVQARIMQAGMSFFIDVRGRKKEFMGIQFPIVNENSPDLPAGRNPDVTAIRSMMILNLIKLKLFGFSGDVPPYQELMVPGSVNVAYSWDSLKVMHIEYRIPLSILGDAASLDQKNISIGWKIHPVQSAMQNPTVTSTSTRVVGGRSNSRPAQTPDLNIAGNDRRNVMTDEQQIWSKYLITIRR